MQWRLEFARDWNRNLRLVQILGLCLVMSAAFDRQHASHSVAEAPREYATSPVATNKRLEEFAESLRKFWLLAVTS